MPDPDDGKQKSLFSQDQAPTLLPSGPKRRGYAAPPGSGPPLDTCATCKHMIEVRSGPHRTHKCQLRIDDWRDHPASPATSIAPSSPACRAWQLAPRLDIMLGYAGGRREGPTTAAHRALLKSLLS